MLLISSGSCLKSLPNQQDTQEVPKDNLMTTDNPVENCSLSVLVQSSSSFIQATGN